MINPRKTENYKTNPCDFTHYNTKRTLDFITHNPIQNTKSNPLSYPTFSSLQTPLGQTPSKPTTFLNITPGQNQSNHTTKPLLPSHSTKTRNHHGITTPTCPVHHLPYPFHKLHIPNNIKCLSPYTRNLRPNWYKTNFPAKLN